MKSESVILWNESEPDWQKSPLDFQCRRQWRDKPAAVKEGRREQSLQHPTPSMKDWMLWFAYWSSSKPPRKILLPKLFCALAVVSLLVEQRDICFASIEEGTISVATHSIEGQSNCRTLEDLLELLDPELFWRAHRSFVVNIHRIQEVVPWFKSSYQLRMDDRRHTEIPVSRNQTKRLRELFNL